MVRQSDYSELTAKNDYLYKNLVTTEKRLAIIENDLENTKKKLVITENELDSTKKNFAVTEKKLESINKKLAGAKKELEFVYKKNAELDTMIIEFRKKIGDLTKEYEELFQLKSILEVSESTLSNKIRSLEAEKGRNEDEITCLKNDLKQLCDKSNEIEKRLKKINEDRKKEIKQKDERIIELEHENLELLKQKKYCKK
ncbi:27164_t:CDS:1 [Gigaspora margarita]|uniref:27164_t:CDS:1 n=1 Tax=Gigaspora margarita TaxID=4874 RepID=A0ABM8VVY5_GIGMA|nr:27164_t:CDS:1 [Gigaspora margarita]